MVTIAVYCYADTTLLRGAPFTAFPSMTTLYHQLIEAPASDEAFVRETLAYIDAHDGVSNEEYAFVAYKETHRSSGAWCVRIASRHSSASVFNPNAIRLQARAIGDQGKRSFVWGNPLSPKLGDPRRIEFRVYVAHGEPTSVEIFVRLRRFDHTADEARMATFPWPTH
jgi:hypothetical protein